MGAVFAKKKHMCVSVCLSVSVFVSFRARSWVCKCLSLGLCLSPSLYAYLCVSLCLCLSHFVFLRPSLGVGRSSSGTSWSERGSLPSADLGTALHILNSTLAR